MTFLDHRYILVAEKVNVVFSRLVRALLERGLALSLCPDGCVDVDGDAGCFVLAEQGGGQMSQ